MRPLGGGIRSTEGTKCSRGPVARTGLMAGLMVSDWLVVPWVTTMGMAVLMKVFG